MPTTLDLTLGALEVGIAISTCLYGVTTVQAYLYACSENDDRLFLQIFVLCIWVIETIDTIALWIYLYITTVTNFGQLTILDKVPWYLGITVTLSALVGSSVQAFFAYRVKVVSGRWYIALVAWTGAVLRLAFGFISCIAGIRAESLKRFSVDWNWLIIGSTSVEIITDIWNTGSLCLYLAPQRTEFKRTRNLINKIMLWTVEIGVVTCLGAISMLIFILALPHALLWVSIITFYPKLYSISLLISLNGRKTLRRDAVETLTYRSILWTQDDRAVPSTSMYENADNADVEMNPGGSRVTAEDDLDMNDHDETGIPIPKRRPL